MQKTITYIFLLFFLFFGEQALSQTFDLRGEVVSLHNNLPIAGADVYLKEIEKTVSCNEQGFFAFKSLKAKKYNLICYAEGYNTFVQEIDLQQNEQIEIFLDSLEMDLPGIEVEAKRRESFGLRRLNNVEGMAIYAAKKSEVIEFENLVANLATNNPRQVYKSIPGLNIWESDGAGLQLSIGARGLDPNRTSNFNTRQNGYDISADALGYPESYYTPPTQALKKIEIVRGAASLQYGPQFGGLLNFVLKKGPRNKPFEFTTENTIGSFGLINSFNSIGGSKNDWNYYAYFQYKKGNGWRPFSQFNQKAGYVHIDKKLGKRWKIGFDFTHMDYLAQQPGGLEDFQFSRDARVSKRSRNWFAVDWNLAALTVDFKITDKTKINSRSFLLDAQREALGALNPINRPDPLTERDLIRGQYNNFGNETRLIHRYKLGEQITTFLAGVRYYEGFTQNQQGLASANSDADFTFLNPTELERSDYEFPSNNFAFFAENLFYLNNKLSITPGIRMERIKTESQGFFKETITSGDSVLLVIKKDDARLNKRNFILAGLGTGYKVTSELELYANFSQNYRSINFSDLAVVNPNLIIDSLLTDEKGYNLDLGLRGQIFKNAIQLDLSIFYLNYQNRIGTSEIIVQDNIGIEKAIAFTTNVGNAYVLGLESYLEAKLLDIFNIQSENFTANFFTNFSLLKSAYKTDDQKINGNEVELVPSFSLKTGLTLGYKNLKVAYQFGAVGSQFSDATNATMVADATRGIIPTYQIHDLSLSFKYRWIKLQAGINNLLDARYFTRRAAAYPGPGIIPAEARNFYLTLGLKF